MSAEKLKESAMYYFATYGYEGISLSQIAEKAFTPILRGRMIFFYKS